MPRDADVADIELPGGRRGRVVETIAAGQFAIQAQSTTIDQLYAAGHLGPHEFEAAAVLAETFEQSRVRPRLTGAYDGVLIDGPVSTGTLLETLNATELRAWRRTGRLLNAIPRRHRTQVAMVVCWDARPWDVHALQIGLRAIARALRSGR